jgi:hypothetical protein
LLIEPTEVHFADVCPSMVTLMDFAVLAQLILMAVPIGEIESRDDVARPV